MGTGRAVGAVLAGTVVVARAGEVDVVVASVVVVDVLVDVVVVEVDVVGSGAGPVSSTVVPPPHAVNSTRSKIPPIRRMVLASTGAGPDLSVPLASS